MIRRIVAIIIVIFIFLSCCAFVHADDGEKKSGLFSYKLKGNGTAVITGFDWESNKENDIYIPRMIDGYIVTEIGRCAFSFPEEKLDPVDDNYDFVGISHRDVYLNSVYGVVILPDTITTINDYAFRATAISSINIPSSVQIIGSGAFADCAYISAFSVDPGNETYATIDGVLYNKKEKALLAVPIGRFGFVTSGKNYKLLKEPFKIPDGIVTIGDYAFHGVSLSCEDGGIGIVIPESVKHIGRYAFAFSHFGSWEHEYWNDGSNSPELIFPGIETIDDYAFAWAVFNCQVDFPSVKEIGNYAFRSCTAVFSSFNNFVFPASLTKIGEGSFCKFYGRSRRSNIDLDFSQTQITDISSKAFFEFNKGSYDGVKTKTTATWPPFLLTIGDEAFRGTSFKSKVVLPDSLKVIGNKSFYKTDLELLYIPSSVDSIGEEVVYRNETKLQVEAGSFAELYASENGITYTTSETDDTSWLND